MARQITTIRDLQVYLRSLHANARHHANGMLDVFPKVMAAAIERMDGDTFWAYEREGQVKNAAWVSLGGKSYFFSYDHERHAVAMKEQNIHGPVIARFSDKDSFEEVSRRIRRLTKRTMTMAASPT